MQISTVQPELLVPPKRLGKLLAEARVARGYSLEEAARSLGGDWGTVELLEAETGRRPLTDVEVKELTDFYEIPTSTLIPERSRLVVDLEEGLMEVGGESVRLEPSAVQRRDVLARYLSMVYAMRDVPPGRPVPLRLPDLLVLEGVFSTHRRQIEDALRELLVDRTGSVGFRTRRLRGRLVVPIAGVVVAATTLGTLLLVSGPSGAAETDGADGPARDVTEAHADEPEVEIGDAVVQERLPDGTPGPVVPRS